MEYSRSSRLKHCKRSAKILYWVLETRGYLLSLRTPLKNHYLNFAWKTRKKQKNNPPFCFRFNLNNICCQTMQNLQRSRSFDHKALSTRANKPLWLQYIKSRPVSSIFLNRGLLSQCYHEDSRQSAVTPFRNDIYMAWYAWQEKSLRFRRVCHGFSTWHKELSCLVLSYC